MYTRFAGSAVIGLTACALTAHAEPLSSYHLTQIGPVPINGVGITFVSDINAKGELVAAVQTTDALQINLWRNGQMTIIGETLDGRARFSAILSTTRRLRHRPICASATEVLHYWSLCQTHLRRSRRS
jgi:hypothetical protein